MQKIHDGKKALFYFIPLENSFIISLTLREQERIECLSDDDLFDLRSQIECSKKYVEGYALRFTINNHQSYSLCNTLIKKLIVKRQ